jgi:hypothetical protein
LVKQDRRLRLERHAVRHLQGARKLLS